MADIGVRVLVLGVAEARRNIQAFNSDIQKTTGVIGTLSGTSSRIGQTLSTLGSGLTSVGRSLTIGVTAPIAALTSALVNQGIQFEQAFAGVTKTVDGLATPFGELTDAGRVLRQELIDLSKTMPVSPQQLSALGQIAGQFGIQKQDILEMVEVMAKLEKATDIVGEAQQQSFAQVAIISEVAAEEFDNMASSLVFLGNNFPTTESRIIDFSQIVAGTATAMGFSVDQTLAWGAAITASGIHAETGATAMARVLKDMSLAISAGGDDLDKFAAIAGVSASRFAEAFEQDASGAVRLFVEGLAEMDPQQQISSLDSLGLSAQRVGSTLLNLAANQDLLGRALDGSEDAFMRSIALQEEFAKQTNTVQAAIQVLKNNFIALGIAVFEANRDKILAFINAVQNLVQKLTDLDPQILGTITTILGIAAAIGPILVVAGLLISALGTVATAIGAILTPIGLLIAGFVALGVVIGSIIGWENVLGFLQQLGDVFLNIGRWLGAVMEDGDWLNDWLSHLPEPIAKVLAALGLLLDRNTSKTFQDLFGPGVGDFLQSIKDKVDLVRDSVEKFFEGLPKIGFKLEFGQSLAAMFPPELEGAVYRIQTSIVAISDVLSGRAPIDSLLPSWLVTDGAVVAANMERISMAVADMFLGLDTAPAEHESLVSINNFVVNTGPNLLLILQGLSTVISDVTTAAASVAEVFSAIGGTDLQLTLDNITSSLHAVNTAGQTFADTWNTVWSVMLIFIKVGIGITAFMVGELLVSIFAVIGGLSAFVEGLVRTINAVIGFGTQLVATFVAAADFVEAIIDSLSMSNEEGTRLIFTSWANLMGELGALFMSLWRVAGEIWKGILETIVTTVGLAVAGTIDLFNGLVDILVGHSIIPDLVKKVTTHFTEMAKNIGSILLTIGTAFDGFITKVVNVGATIKTQVDKMVADFRRLLSSITSSPELTIQHPFERFENFLKTADFSIPLNARGLSTAIAGMSQVMAPSTTNNTTSIQRNVTFGPISGVPFTGEVDLAELLQQKMLALP